MIHSQPRDAAASSPAGVGPSSVTGPRPPGATDFVRPTPVASLGHTTGAAVRMRQEQGGSPEIEAIIEKKHRSYLAAAQRYACLYYLIRLSAGLSAGLLPFVISHNINIATGLSIVVVVATVIDMVFNPKDRWILYSKATDLLTLAEAKARGEYGLYKELLDVIFRTEGAKLERLIDVSELLQKIDDAPATKQSHR